MIEEFPCDHESPVDQNFEQFIDNDSQQQKPQATAAKAPAIASAAVEDMLIVVGGDMGNSNKISRKRQQQPSATSSNSNSNNDGMQIGKMKRCHLRWRSLIPKELGWQADADAPLSQDAAEGSACASQIQVRDR